MHAAVSRGAQRIVRLHPFRVVRCDPMGSPLDVAAALKAQRTETLRSVEVGIRSACGQYAVRGWGHASRVSAAQANEARRQCRQRQKKGAPKASTLFLAGWVLVCTTRSPEVVSAQTIMNITRCRWHIALAITRWKSVRNVDALRATEGSPLARVWLHGT